MKTTSRLGLLLAAVGLAACAPAIQRGAKAGVEGSLEAVSEPDNRARAAELARSPEVQEATRTLAASAAEGLVEGVRAELTSTELAEGSDQLVAGAGEHIESLLRENVASGAAAVVRRSIDASLRTAASDANLERTRTVVTATTQAAVRGVTAALADGLQQDLGPALTSRNEHGQSLAAAILDDPELRQALGALAHEISRETVLGSEEALDTIRKQRERGDVFGNVARVLGIGVGVLIAFLAAVAITFIALVVFVFRGSSQRKHLERDIRQRERMMTQMLQATLAGRRGDLDAEQREHEPQA